MPDPARPRFQFTFVALPDSVPPIHRVRALLKRALRDLNLKCLSARELPTDDPETTPEEKPTP